MISKTTAPRQVVRSLPRAAGALAAVALFFGTCAGTRASTTYSFTNITGNNAANAAAGESQLTVTVGDGGSILGSNYVTFTFANAGPAASSITQIYFDDGSLLATGTVSNGTGTNFVFNPGGNLPGGNAINFNESSAFSAEPSPPVQPNGVNPGETVTLSYQLQGGLTYNDTILAMALSLANPGVDMAGGLRIGIHVQGFSNGGSESFVNGGSTSPGPAVPEPSTIAMLVSGLLPLGLIGVRRVAGRRSSR